MSKKEDRIKGLLEVLQKRQGVTVKELSNIFDVSEMTIRRDMELLRQNNLILDIPGAAIFNANNAASSADSYSILAATDTRVKEKEKIGQYAASLLEDGDCVIIDNGTTTERLAAAIPPYISVAVLTSNLNIVNRLTQKPNISITCGGGYYNQDTGLFESPESISLINKSRATKVFCSAAGIHETMGVTCMNSYEVETKRAAMNSGAQKILLVDSSKFGLVKSFYLADIADYDLVITDSELSAQWREKLQEQGVKLVIL